MTSQRLPFLPDSFRRIKMSVRLAFWLTTLAASRADADVDFQKDVAPVFAEHCLQCHGPDKAKGGLNLTSMESATKALKSGHTALVPGQPDRSEMLARLTSTDPEEQMPPKEQTKRPTEQQIALLREWIASGAQWTPHWAYVPVQRPPVPAVKDAAAVRNTVDAFIVAGLDTRGIAPSPEADRFTLIKRVYYDLLGLPPTPEEVDAFVADAAPDAFEKLVDRTLASPHFGERWGRHWLDMARYADSDGYEKDSPRPDAWRYRDWVIEAFNQDMPFDQFTIEQMAGDLLPKATPEQKLATAFHRQTLTNREGGVDQEQFRVEAVFDRTETTGSVWMGLTVGCARCHSHKYDQISQQEYYQLFAFFNNADETNTKVGESSEALARYEKANTAHLAKVTAAQAAVTATRAALEEKLADWYRDFAPRLAAHKSGALPLEAAELPPAKVETLIATGLEKWTEENRETIVDWLAQQDPAALAAADALKKVTAAGPKAPLMKVRVISQRTKQPRTTHVLHRGEFLQPGEAVAAGTFATLPPLQPRAQLLPDRLDLANWLVSRQHPLTARVAVNHLWARLFGEGLVRTPGDFGVRGERPQHPELLDWLAAEFMDRGWSRKQIMRTILTSAAWRRSSQTRPDLRDSDPLNVLLARQNRVRVEGEIVRDLHLAASGLLSRKIGGPSVYPPLPPEVAAFSYANNFKWSESTGADRHRRGMYTFFKRTAPHPDLMVFDCPDANLASVERNVSNTPLQALTTLNAQSFTDAAKALAAHVLKTTGDDTARLTVAFRRCLGRKPSGAELGQLQSLLAKSRETFASEGKSGEGAEQAAWFATVRIILNTDEFITRD